MDKNEREKIIFLDIDGVLNTYSTKATSYKGCIGVEDRLLMKLQKLVNETGAKIVLSSSWRFEWFEGDGKDGKYLKDKFAEFGLEIFDTTTINGTDRGWQIRQYLEKYPEIKRFIIIDDEFAVLFKKSNLTKYLLSTSPLKGITDGTVTRGIKYLNEVKKDLY